MKVLIYTAIFNKYDCLQDVKEFKNYANFYCVTDSPEYYENRGWNVFKMPVIKNHPKLSNRVEKINAFIYSEGYYDITVYIDGNKWITNIDILLEHCTKLYKSNKNLYLPKHWGRNKVREECDEVVRLGLDNPKVVNKQYQNYIKEGFKDDLGLFCASVQIRKDKYLNEFFKIWLNEVIHNSIRDQISLPYALWKSKAFKKLKIMEIEELRCFVRHKGHIK